MWFLSGGILSNANPDTVDKAVEKVRWVLGNILNLVRLFGTGLALIMLTWMAIRYFSADGRGVPWAAEKKAKLKGEELKNFAIGVIVFIGASNILYFITEFVIKVVGGIGS